MTTAILPRNLEETRLQAARVAFEETYDFEDTQVEDSSGFEWNSGEATFTKPVFFADATDADGASVLGHFTVTFDEGTADISGCYASIDGNDVGFYPPLRSAGMGM